MAVQQPREIVWRRHDVRLVREERHLVLMSLTGADVKTDIQDQDQDFESFQRLVSKTTTLDVGREQIPEVKQFS